MLTFACSRKEYEDTRKLKRLSFKSVKASVTGRMKEAAAKEQQEYQTAFEQERGCSLQLEKEIAELNQATILVCTCCAHLDQSHPGLTCFQRDRTKESKDEIERLRKALDQLYEEVQCTSYHQHELY